MISFSIIFSCVIIVVSGILEEKHLIFDDPVHGPHDRLSSADQISASDLSHNTSQIVSPVPAQQLLRGLRSLAPRPRLPRVHDDSRGAEAVLQVGCARRGGGIHRCVP